MSSNMKKIDNEVLGQMAEEIRIYREELEDLEKDFEKNPSAYFAKLDEIKELPHLPKDNNVCEFKNFKVADDENDTTYASANRVILTILKEDKSESWSDEKEEREATYYIPLEAANRIHLFHHVGDKIDLIIAAIFHADTEVKKVGIAEYKKLPAEAKSRKEYFPPKVAGAIKEIIQKINN